jgi:hypothetical protein
MNVCKNIMTQQTEIKRVAKVSLVIEKRRGICDGEQAVPLVSPTNMTEATLLGPAHRYP